MLYTYAHLMSAPYIGMYTILYLCYSGVIPLFQGTLGNLTSYLCWAWLAGPGWGIHTGGYLLTDDTERSHF